MQLHSVLFSTPLLFTVSLFKSTTAQIGPPGWQQTGVYAIYNLATNTSLDLVNGNATNGAPMAG